MNKKQLLVILALFAILDIIALPYLPWQIALIPGLIYSLIIPGMLLYLFIYNRIKLTIFNFIIVIGLGIWHVLFSGLLINWMGQLFGIVNPLDYKSLVIGSFVILVIEAIISYTRWDIIPLTIAKTKNSRLDLLTITLSLLLPVLSIFGAISLNNGGSGVPAILVYFYSISLLIFAYIFSQKLNLNSLIFSVWMIGLALILQGWLRSKYILGPDVSKEFQLFQLVKNNGKWSIDSYRDAYNACLSINILPTYLTHLTKAPDLLVFKFVLPTLYSLLVPIVFIISNTLKNRRNSLIAAFFFISQPVFTTWWWIPIRQQIAFLFFGLIIMLYVKNKGKDLQQQLIIILFCMGMVVSHYSTSYIALALLVTSLLLKKVLSKFTPLRQLDNTKSIKYSTVIIVTLFTFLWYSQVAYGLNALTNFLGDSFSNFGKTFSSEVQQNGQSALSRFNIFSKAGTTRITAQEYEQDKVDLIRTNSNPKNFYIETEQNLQPHHFDLTQSKIALKAEFLRNILKMLGNLIICVSVLAVLYKVWKTKAISTLATLQLGGFLFLCIALFLPYFSINYGPDRLYQQLLIILAICVPNLVNKSTYFAKRNILSYLLLIFVIMYFIILNQLPQNFMNTYKKNISINNFGIQKSAYYVTENDSRMFVWLGSNTEVYPIYGDSYSSFKLMSTGNINLNNRFRAGVIPDSITKNSYVVKTSSNTETRSAFDRVGGDILYEFPEEFLSTNKNQVYSTSNSGVFK